MKKKRAANPPPATPRDGVCFNASIRVQASELVAWETSRLQAFMRGIAKVLQVKAKAGK